MRGSHQLRALAVTLFCGMLGIVTAAAFAADSIPQRTITTQDRSGAVILWDATANVDRFAQDGTPARDAVKALETEAVALFIRNAPLLAANARHLRVVVSYVQTGATEARYQTKTFAGVKPILTVQGKISRGMRFPRNWQADLQRGAFPPSLSVDVARDLPTDRH
ncbi:MAG: hypothetical protein JOZ59_06350 [Candidatus Eremiobacteraeota bacterium]|nr:hypothetical protein [Candidatus Eremiobacteraeota bacterium]